MTTPELRDEAIQLRTAQLQNTDYVFTADEQAVLDSITPEEEAAARALANDDLQGLTDVLFPDGPPQRPDGPGGPPGTV